MSVARNPRVMFGVTALAGLTALGGIGAVINHDDAVISGTQGAHFDITAVATTDSAPPTSGSTSTLMRMLGPGFTASNCGASAKLLPGSSATVVCKQNPNGPSGGLFALFPDQGAMDSAFDQLAGEDQLAPCIEGMTSPGSWGPTSDPGQTKGRIACGTYKGKADLIWTENSILVLGNIQGSSIDSLYTYWSAPPPNAAPEDASGKSGHA